MSLSPYINGKKGTDFFSSIHSWSHGKRLADRVRGFTELLVNDETLRLLAVRQIELVEALLRRGHASRDKIRIHSKDSSKKAWMKLRLPAVLEKAKVNPAWSRLNGPELATLGSDTSLLAAKEDLARRPGKGDRFIFCV